MAQVVQFIVTHQALLAGLGVAILDLMFALSDNIKANSVLQFVYQQLAKIKGSSQPPQA